MIRREASEDGKDHCVTTGLRLMQILQLWWRSARLRIQTIMRWPRMR